MIEKITISNFKSIEKLELDLGRVNVLIGENGCGKTNILEGIGFGSIQNLENYNHLQKGIREIEFQKLLNKAGAKPKGSVRFTLIDSSKNKVDIWANYVPEQFKFGLWYGGIDEPISIEKTATLSWAKAKFSEDKLDDVDREFIKISREALKFEEENSFSNFTIYTPENSILRKFDEENYLKPLGVGGEGLFKELQKIIRNQPEKFNEIKEGLKAIDWFEDLELPEDLFVFEKRINIKDRYLGSNPDVQFLDQRSANEGFLFLLFYFTLFVSDDTPKFFAIDNIDQALNPRLCIRLIQTLTEMAKKHHKQVIFTTHNPSILDGLDLDDDQQRLHVVYRNADGNTVVKRHLRKKGLPGVEPVRLSEAFIRGYLGGLPKHF